MAHKAVASSPSFSVHCLPLSPLVISFWSLLSSFISQNVAGSHIAQWLSTCCSNYLEHSSPITSSVGQLPLILLGMSASLYGPVKPLQAADLPSLGPYHTSCILISCVVQSLAQAKYLIDMD